MLRFSVHCDGFMNELLHSKDEWHYERPSLTTNKNISDIFNNDIVPAL